ncbi:MAG: hypothetical protein WC879_09880 [Melioribacteraceae bacterium]
MKKYLFIFLVYSLALTTAQNNDGSFFYTNTQVIKRLAIANIDLLKMLSLERRGQNKKNLDTNYIRQTFPGFGLKIGIRENGGNSVYIGEIIDTLYERGEYEYLFKYEISTREGYEHQDSSFYNIKVKYPTLAAEDHNRDTLFWGEEFKFSFATVEYNNKNAYSYEIYINGNVKPDTVEPGTPLVDLTKFLDAYSTEKSTIKVIGKYNSRTFNYYDNKNSLQSSNWEFKILKPNSAWLDQSIGSNQSMIIIDGPSDSATNTFEVMLALYYYGKDGNKRIFISPDVKDVTEDQNKYKVRYENGPVSSFIYLSIDLNKIPIEEEANFNFSITAKTKYGNEEHSGKQNVKIYRRN